jgi:hypothetical protein
MAGRSSDEDGIFETRKDERYEKILAGPLFVVHHTYLFV